MFAVVLVAAITSKSTRNFGCTNSRSRSWSIDISNCTYARYSGYP